MDTRELAFADWQNGMKYSDIAEKHGVSLSAVKSWASRDWKHRKVATTPGKKLQPKKGKSRPKGGAPPGNQNAAGHGAPHGNKNSEKHGIYAKVFGDILTDEENEILSIFHVDKAQHLFDEVRLLTVRERRLMLMIQELGDAPRGMLIQEVYRSEEKREFASPEEREQYEERQRLKVEQDKLMPGHSFRVGTTSVNSKDLLLRAHAELTRVQSQKARVLAQLNQMEIERERLDLEQRRLDLDLMKIEVEQQAQMNVSDSEASNFLEAMMGVVENIWGDGDKADDGTDDK